MVPDEKVNKDPLDIAYVPSVSEAHSGGTVFSASPTASAPVASRFSRWIRNIAIVVLAVFIPDQVSWAFSYNPAVLWGEKAGMVRFAQPGIDLPQPAAQKAVSQVPQSVEYLLKQLAGKERSRLLINVDPQSAMPLPFVKPSAVELDTRAGFTKERIDGIVQWLSQPDIHLLNCAVYSLKDILDAQNKSRSLDELAVLAVSVDLISDIIKVGDPKFKTTLFALRKVGDALGTGFVSIKTAPEDVLKLQTPFIAHFKNEHFVTVKKVEGDKVYVADLGQEQAIDRFAFEQNADGFAYAAKPQEGTLAFQYVPESLEAFVWGDKWRDNSGNLPGLLSGSAIAMNIGITVASALLTGGSAMLALSVSNFTQTLATICVQEGVCNAHMGFILQSALSMALTMGLSSGASAGSTGAEATTSSTSSTGFFDGLSSMGDSVTGFFSDIGNSVNGFFSDFFGGAAVESTAASTATETIATTTAANTAATTSTAAVMSFGSFDWGAFGKGFAVGLIVGAAKAEAQYQAAKMVDKFICSDPGKTCSDSNTIIKEGVTMIAASLAGSLTVATLAVAGDAMGLGTERMFGLTTNPKDKYAPSLSFSDAISKTLWDQRFVVVGQLASTAIRLGALGAGVKADSSMSTILGTLGSSIATEVTRAYTGTTPWTMKDNPDNLFENPNGGGFLGSAASRIALRTVFALGLSQLEKSVLGPDDKSYSYRENKAAFRTLMFLTSALITDFMTPGTPANQAGLGPGHYTLEQGSYAPNYLGTNVPASHLAGGFNYLTGSGYMQEYINTGSWGSVTNAMQFMDSMNSVTGFTFQSALQAERMQAQMKAADAKALAEPIAATRVIGGLIVPNYIAAKVAAAAASQGTFNDRYLLALWQSHLLLNPGINPDAVNSAFGTAITDNLADLTIYVLRDPAQLPRNARPTAGSTTREVRQKIEARINEGTLQARVGDGEFTDVVRTADGWAAGDIRLSKESLAEMIGRTDKELAQRILNDEIPVGESLSGIKGPPPQRIEPRVVSGVLQIRVVGQNGAAAGEFTNVVRTADGWAAGDVNISKETLANWVGRDTPLGQKILNDEIPVGEALSGAILPMRRVAPPVIKAGTQTQVTASKLINAWDQMVGTAPITGTPPIWSAANFSTNLPTGDSTGVGFNGEPIQRIPYLPTVSSTEVPGVSVTESPTNRINDAFGVLANTSENRGVIQQMFPISSMALAVKQDVVITIEAAQDIRLVPSADGKGYVIPEGQQVINRGGAP